jgi:hypothetical protein
VEIVTIAHQGPERRRGWQLIIGNGFNQPSKFGMTGAHRDECSCALAANRTGDRKRPSYSEKPDWLGTVIGKIEASPLRRPTATGS